MFSAQNSIASQPYLFSNQKAADDFIKQEQAKGKRTNLTVQRQDKQRYSILLKGYRQWSSAVKQVQLLEKHGFSNQEIVKGRYERGYSIIVMQSLNKISAGTAFNRLRALGVKNVKVHRDNIKRVQYVVMLHEPVPIQAQDEVIISRHETAVPKPLIKLEVPEQKSEFLESELINIPDNDLKEEDVIIVMSDSSDITDEIFFAQEDNSETNNFEWAIDKVQMEVELFTRTASPVDHVEYIHASSHARWQLSPRWEAQIAARVDGNYQHGKDSAETDELDLDYGNIYLRYRHDKMRFTVGSDTVRWGKVDNFAPTDNMATLDLSRGVLYKWGEAYRSAPTFRTEFFLDQGKIDIVYLPYFREAELPDKDNVWYPVNSRNGTILGFDESQQLRVLLQNGKIDDDIDETDGGFGIRFSSGYESLDYDIVIQKVKLSMPYYQLNPVIRANPLAANSERYAFKEIHPRSWILGADIAFQAEDMLLRFEGAWFSDLPATTQDFEYKNYHGFKWAAGVELYPGDGNTRLNLQLSGRHIDEKKKIVDRDNLVRLSGEIETLFSNNRWQLSAQFNLGLDEKDIYIAPEIAYLGWEPFEFYSAIHFLEGHDNTIGGFYQENSMITFGWRGKY